MSDEWKQHVKMRGSIWGVLAGLVAGVIASGVSASHQDPAMKRYMDCGHREWNERRIYSRPAEPIRKEIDEICRREMLAKP